MVTVESILYEVRQLAPQEQDRLMQELCRTLLAEAVTPIGSQPETPLPLTDEEINQIVHETRGEILRARGL